jgi:hypothetical protein
MNLRLRVILQTPPANVHFGLQKGSGNNYETVQVQLSKNDDLYFELAVEVKGDRQKDEMPAFKGPFVQGPAGAKFLYIDIGTYAGQADQWSRRLKIPLTGITWEMSQAAAQPGIVLEASVPGTGKDGTPNCATVKPFGGWHLKTLAG